MNNTLPITKNLIILNVIIFILSEYLVPSLQEDFAGYLLRHIFIFGN